MQLEDLNSYVVIRPGDFIHASKILSAYIDYPPEDNLTFSYNLSQHKRFCPRLFDAFGESKKPLKKRSRDERVYLKQKLLEDMEANIAAADAQFGGEKRLGTDILPSDPDACMERLGHMKSELHTQIQALERLLHKQLISHVSAEILKHPLDISWVIVITGLDQDLSTNPSPTPVRPVHAA